MKHAHSVASSLFGVIACVSITLAVITYPKTVLANDDQAFCGAQCFTATGGWPPGPGNTCAVDGDAACSSFTSCNLCVCNQDNLTRDYLCQ